MHFIRNSFILLFLISPVYGEVKGKFDVAITGETGNAHTRTVALNNSTEKDIGRFTLKNKLNYSTYIDDHRLISEKYFFSEQADWRYREHPFLDYMFQRYAWDKDRARNIKSRSALGVGHGFDLYEFISRTDNRLSLFLELGEDYTWEGRRDNSFSRFGSARSFITLKWEIPKEKTDLQQDIEYFLDFGEGNGHRINTITSVERELKSYIALKLSFETKFDSTPVENVKKRDTLTNLFLTVKY